MAAGSAVTRVAAVSLVATVATATRRPSSDGAAASPACRGDPAIGAGGRRRPRRAASRPPGGLATRPGPGPAPGPGRRPARSPRPRRAGPGLARRLLGHQSEDVWGVALLVLAILCGLSIYSGLAGPAGRRLDHGAADLLGGGPGPAARGSGLSGLDHHPGSGPAGLRADPAVRPGGPARPAPRPPPAAAARRHRGLTRDRPSGDRTPGAGASGRRRPGRVAVGAGGPAGRRAPA